MNLNHITALSACQLSTAIHQRQVSCQEVMQAYLTCIAQHNGTHNAIVSLRDNDVLMTQAQDKDTLLAQGLSQGWMHGFPQAPKDLTATAGLASTLGFRGLAKQVPAHDSIMASRLRGAGSIFIGKTNTPEFGLGSHTYNALFGTTRNAYNPSQSAGGSSGGSAVALALNMLPVADGSDMMGSLRNPAGWNNVYGLRPSQGRVPYGSAAGAVGDVFFQQLGTEGPMGRCVEDLAQLLAVQSGYHPRAPLSLTASAAQFAQPLQANFAGKRVGWLGSMDGYLAIESEVMQVCETALGYFQTLGAQVDAVMPQTPMDAVWEAWLTLRALSVSGHLAAIYSTPALRDLLKPEAMWECEQAAQYGALPIHRASITRSQWYAQLLHLFETHDYLVLPSAQCFAFDAGVSWPKQVAGKPMDTYHRWMEVTIYATLAGLPALAVPAGFSSEGSPMGLQIIGKPQGEWDLLQLGYAWQQATPFGAVRPSALGPLGKLGKL